MEILTGPKGGKYYINEKGKKVYISTKKSKKEPTSKTSNVSDWWESSSKSAQMSRLVNYVHHETVRHCEYCGAPMSRSDVNDFGSLCERCYMKEYYNSDVQ